ncbi:MULTISPECIES: oxidoreductase [Paenibacillus]|uniref:Oxidoreductase n=1 Tax=Paenibacillus borealis TaxID=160799 RepID=A0ABX3HBE6_PAEBO|nr:oxidoreductase [Paenibacillus borealis]OMD47806.1 oxidoreductase [Paenibacillus borealis]
MKNINHLQTNPSSRYNDSDPEQDGNKNTKFADLIIDGSSLYQMLKKYDMVPSLGWGSEGYQRQMIDYFLLKQTHPYLYYRYPILVCPWCGDEECGFISVFIEREGDLVIWQDFKLEPDNKRIHIGPFYFKWVEYESAINNTYGTAGVQKDS